MDTAQLLTIPETAERLSVGRTRMFELLKAGEIESVLIGRSRRIPADAVGEYINRLRGAKHDAA